MAITNYEGNKFAIGVCFEKTEHMYYDGMLAEYTHYYDVENNKVVKVQTGYYGADGSNMCDYHGATIDLTMENARVMIKKYIKPLALSAYAGSVEKFKKELHKGNLVEVVRGRKVTKGTMGIVFWIGEKYNQYSRCNEVIVGIKKDPNDKNEKPIWIKTEYLKKLTMEKSPNKKERDKFIKSWINRYHDYVSKIAKEG